MKRISDKDYNEYMTLLEQRRNGEILTFDGLELIIKANEFDFEKIGEQIVKSWFKIKRRKIKGLTEQKNKYINR